VGAYIGWQIVNSYMKNNEVSLQQLLRTNAQEIFEKSNINLKVMSDKDQEIKFLVELDENRVPEKLLWSAQRWWDRIVRKAIMLSVWDSRRKVCVLIYGRKKCLLTK
jgi:hypothetical protein